MLQPLEPGCPVCKTWCTVVGHTNYYYQNLGIDLYIREDTITRFVRARDALALWLDRRQDG